MQNAALGILLNHFKYTKVIKNQGYYCMYELKGFVLTKALLFSLICIVKACSNLNSSLRLMRNWMGIERLYLNMFICMHLLTKMRMETRSMYFECLLLWNKRIFYIVISLVWNKTHNLILIEHPSRPTCKAHKVLVIYSFSDMSVDILNSWV